MTELEQYFADDQKAYTEFLLAHYAGHICFECRKPLKADGRDITMTLVGPMPIYSHTTCRYPEQIAQEIHEKIIAEKGNVTHEN